MRLILFDCDGTLVDSAGHIVSAMQSAFRAHDLEPPSDEAVKGIIGLSLPVAIAELLGDTGHPPEQVVEAYKSVYRDAVAEGADHEPLFDGVETMLGRVESETTLLGVATGKSRAGLDRILKGHGLTGRFVVTKTADDATSKPAPDMVLQAVRETGADLSRTLVVGDSGFDMKMARAAGAFALGVTWGYQPRARLESTGAHAIAERMEDLPDLIDGLVAP